MAPSSPARSATTIMCLVKPGGHAEGGGEHADDLVAVVEVGPDHQVLLVELPGDEPALVTPLQPALRSAPAVALQLLGQPVCLLDDHHGSVARDSCRAPILKPAGPMALAGQDGRS